MNIYDRIFLQRHRMVNSQKPTKNMSHRVHTKIGREPFSQFSWEGIKEPVIKLELGNRFRQGPEWHNMGISEKQDIITKIARRLDSEY